MIDLSDELSTVVPVGDGVGDVVSVGVAVAVAVAVGDVVSVGLAVAVAVGLGDALTVAVGLGDGELVGEDFVGFPDEDPDFPARAGTVTAETAATAAMSTVARRQNIGMRAV